MTSAEILARLVAFPSVSERSNADIQAYVAAFLAEHGVEAELLWSPDQRKANLFATLGPRDRAGIVLSGHTDVVPVEGQAWSSDPFGLTYRDGRYYGRGAADMKGFLACVLSFVGRLDARAMKTPLHLCFSHDEEIGCVGVRPMLAELSRRAFRPSLCIVGEPTLLRVATGHKGKLAARATCMGREGHSALAPKALNAIHLAADLLSVLRKLQDGLSRTGARDEDYDIPYSTVHAGMIAGGTALNIVPNRCTLDFEIRTIGADRAVDILARIEAETAIILKAARKGFPEADITFEVVNAYPGLDTPETSEALRFVRALVGDASPLKVAYGTEGGLFHEILDVPTVICGPGSMAQGHRPDEFIAAAELDRCDAVLDRLAARLAN